MTVTRITTAPAPARPWGRLRGTWAVAVLLLSALDHLAAALVGSRPVGYLARRVAAPIADAWRSAARRPMRTESDTALIYVASPTSERGHDDGRTSS